MRPRPRSEAEATEFAARVGVTTKTLYGWRKRFEAQGPAALVGHRKGTTGGAPVPRRLAPRLDALSVFTP